MPRGKSLPLLAAGLLSLSRLCAPASAGAQAEYTVVNKTAHRVTLAFGNCGGEPRPPGIAWVELEAGREYRHRLERDYPGVWCTGVSPVNGRWAGLDSPLRISTGPVASPPGTYAIVDPPSDARDASARIVVPPGEEVYFLVSFYGSAKHAVEVLANDTSAGVYRASAGARQSKLQRNVAGGPMTLQFVDRVEREECASGGGRKCRERALRLVESRPQVDVREAHHMRVTFDDPEPAAPASDRGAVGDPGRVIVEVWVDPSRTLGGGRR
jgi:hypothetical protein